MGRKRIDLSGNKYNRLTVVEYSHSDKNGNSFWKCECSCGNVGVFKGSSLKNGSTQSCGCLLTDTNKTFIGIGETFGRLTVIKEIGKDKHKRFLYLCKCNCGSLITVNSNKLLRGNTKSCGCYCDYIRRNNASGANSNFWKGGVRDLNLPLYTTYCEKLSYVEEVGVDYSIVSDGILKVKCAYCGKWFIPTVGSVRARIKSLIGIGNGEGRFYCSDKCKQACPIFNQKKFPKGFKPATSREVQPELRQLVLARDNWICKKCGATDTELHCHHITGVVKNPIESADLDNCITLCKSCHKEVHRQKDCKYNELRC